MGKLGAVIVAAGKGARMRKQESKQFLPLGGKPLLMHALAVFQGLAEIDAIVLVVAANDLNRCRELVEENGIAKVKAIVVGGDERQDSVYNGLAALNPFSVEWVLVHDAARPLITPTDAIRCLTAAKTYGAAVLGVPVKDTIKIVDEHGNIVETPKRRSLWAAQTPQAFRLFELLQVHERARREHVAGTDDASLLEHYGGQVRMVKGRYDNIKITTAEDLAWAQVLLNERKKEMEHDSRGARV